MMENKKDTELDSKHLMTSGALLDVLLVVPIIAEENYLTISSPPPPNKKD